MGDSGKAHSKCSISVPVSIVHKDLGVRKKREYGLLHDGSKMSMSLETGTALGNIIRENEGSDGPVVNQLTTLWRLSWVLERP